MSPAVMPTVSVPPAQTDPIGAADIVSAKSAALIGASPAAQGDGQFGAA